MQAIRRLALLALLLVVVGCDLLAGWRDSQIHKSGTAASTNSVQPPAQPIVIPSRILTALPVPDKATVVSFMEGGGAVSIHLISPIDTLETCKWLLGRLQQLGYDSDDNPSRILEGVEYRDSRSRFPRVYVKVSLNTAAKCTIEIQAYEEE